MPQPLQQPPLQQPAPLFPVLNRSGPQYPQQLPRPAHLIMPFLPDGLAIGNPMAPPPSAIQFPPPTTIKTHPLPFQASAVCSLCGQMWALKFCRTCQKWFDTQIEQAEERNKRALAEANQRHEQELQDLRQELRKLKQRFGDEHLRLLYNRRQDLQAMSAARRQDNLKLEQMLGELAMREAPHEELLQHQQDLGALKFHVDMLCEEVRRLGQEAEAVRERQQQHHSQLGTACRVMGAVADILREHCSSEAYFQDVATHFAHLSHELWQSYDERLDSGG